MKTLEGSAVEGSIVAGIDVSKASLDVSISAGPVRRFANTPEGIADLVQWLETSGIAPVVCEPTGGYERRWVSGLRAGGLAVHLAHPNRVRDFTRAAGQAAQTDPLDAQARSRYGQVFEPSDTPEPEPEREELRDLRRRRQQLVEQRVPELNRRSQGTAPKARASTARHIDWLNEEIARLDAEYQAALQSSESLAERAAWYRSVPGVGLLTAATLVAELPETGAIRLEGADGPGGTGALAAGQRPPAGPAQHPGAVAAWCVGPCTWRQWRRYAARGACLISTGGCGNGAKPAKWRWWR